MSQCGRESSIQRNVRLEASPPGRIQIVNDETDQEIDRVTFEPGITYRNVQVKAVSGSPGGNLVVITAKSSGWGTGTKELTVEGG